MDIQITSVDRAERFCNIFQHIKVFTDNVNITFDSAQMYIQTMDSSHVSVVEIKLPKEWFDVYHYNTEGTTILGVTASTLFKVLNTRDKCQTIQLVHTDENDKLGIHFFSDNPSVFDKHFEIPLMNIEDDLLAIPDMESDVDMTLPSGNFASIVNHLMNFSDTAEFCCTGENVQVISNGTEVGSMVVDVKHNDLVHYAIKVDTELKASFSLHRLYHICMYNKLAKEVTLHITQNYPMKVTYQLDMPNAFMCFFLAPKIDEM